MITIEYYKLLDELKSGEYISKFTGGYFFYTNNTKFFKFCLGDAAVYELDYTEFFNDVDLNQNKEAFEYMKNHTFKFKFESTILE